MSQLTPLARVRGLGSAKSGTHHWWAQRLTALALIPLGLFFCGAVIVITAGTYAEAKAAISHPVMCALWVMFLVSLTYHAQLGLQVVIEDYLPDERIKFAASIAMKFALFLLGMISVIAVLRAALGS
ncbi:MAG: succinate dehydrogenase / fumarate reductase membrane anchor subunit [Gammaproteobacteria bacterium]|jgi:succinate dehydrogenase / fumarate reductase membrane anchor subunit